MDRRVLTPPKGVKPPVKQALSDQQKQPRPQGAFPWLWRLDLQSQGKAASLWTGSLFGEK